MILVDSSIWIDHINKGEPNLHSYLQLDEALMHPHVLGEIALGSFRDRTRWLPRLEILPLAKLADDDHVLHLIESRSLYATGVGYTDAHLLASCMLMHCGIWTRDKRLHKQAQRLGVAYPP